MDGVAGVAVFLLVGVRTRFGASAPAVGPLHFTQDLPPGTSLASGGLLSPDSRYLVFVAQDENSGKTQLWLRALDSADARPVDGTEGGSRPFWSPDSQSIGFFSGSKVKRVSVTSGPPQTVASTVVAQACRRHVGHERRDSVLGFGLAVFGSRGWRRRDHHACSGSRELRKCALRAPQFLPDGRHFLFVVTSANPDRAGTYVGTLGSQDQTRLLDESNTSVTFVPPGYLTYVREHVLMAQAFDLARLTLTGEARTIAGNVSANPVISASTGGLLAFGGGTTAERLLWFDRSGQRTGDVSVPTVLHNLTFSPDPGHRCSGAAPNRARAASGTSISIAACRRGSCPTAAPPPGHPTAVRLCSQQRARHPPAASTCARPRAAAPTSCC